MPLLSNSVFAGLFASAFSVLMSQTAMAAVVSVHVPVPTVHISVPTVHVAAPTVQVKAPVIKTAAITTDQSTSHHDLQKTTTQSTSHHDLQDGGGDRRGHGAPVSAAKVTGTPFNLRSSLAVNHHGDLPKSGRNGGSQATGNGAPVFSSNIPSNNGRNWPRGGTTPSNQTSSRSVTGLPGAIVQQAGGGTGPVQVVVGNNGGTSGNGGTTGTGSTTTGSGSVHVPVGVGTHYAGGYGCSSSIYTQEAQVLADLYGIQAGIEPANIGTSSAALQTLLNQLSIDFGTLSQIIGNNVPGNANYIYGIEFALYLVVGFFQDGSLTPEALMEELAGATYQLSFAIANDCAVPPSPPI
jgi:hypothetical protein